MNNKLLLLVSFWLLMTNCSEKPLDFTSERFSEKDLPMCQEVSCPVVAIDYVVVTGNEEIAQKINTSIISYLTNAIYIGEQNATPKTKTIAEAVTNFIKEYRLENAEFPAMAVEYFAEASVTKNRADKNIVSLQVDHYIFAGGAHGYGKTKYVNFDAQTGEEYDYQSLIKDHKKFTSFIENAFKKVYDIPLESSINATGFWFKDAVFYVPDNIGFTKDTLMFSYDEYEIASYAKGRIYFEISIKEIEQFLSIKMD